MAEADYDRAIELARRDSDPRGPHGPVTNTSDAQHRDMGGAGQLQGGARLDAAGALRSRAKQMRREADGFDALASMFEAAKQMGTPAHVLEAAWMATLPRR